MRIGITGTQSVGKTTLVKELAKLEQFKDYYCITERSKYLNSLGIPLNTDSTLKGQTIFLAERCSELMNPKLITDRTVIDVMAFSKSAKSIEFSDKISFTNYASSFIKEYDYIFYISPIGIEVEDNGIRETNIEYRNQIDSTIKHYLNWFKFKMKNPYITLQGSTEERINQVLNIF